MSSARQQLTSVFGTCVLFEVHFYFYLLVGIVPVYLEQFGV